MSDWEKEFIIVEVVVKLLRTKDSEVAILTNNPVTKTGLLR